MNPSLAKDAKSAKKRKALPCRYEPNEQDSIRQEMEMRVGLRIGLLGDLGVLGER